MKDFLPVFLFLIIFLSGSNLYSQCTSVPGDAANSCGFSQGGSGIGQFSSTCAGDFTLTSGVYERTTTCYGIAIGNNDTYQIDRNIKIIGNLVLDVNEQGSVFEILDGYTLEITGSLTIVGNSNQERQLVVDGNLIVGGTLDFGERGNGSDQDVEIDGDGHISAGSIANAGNTTCSVDENGGVNNCPDFNVSGPCSPEESGLCTDSALPVELLYFEAVATHGQVDLKWATATEENFDYFTIERSRNASSYEAMGVVQGTGWSNEVVNYTYADNFPLNGRSYYRLKATDLDGTYEYFQPVMVNIQGNNRSISLASNPVGEQLKFKLNFAPEGNMNVSVIDISGTEVFQGIISSGLSIHSLDINLENGVYFLKVSTAEGNYTTRFLKK